MPNRIIYQASTPDEIHQCAYSILKYLEVYNLKPPADHSVVIYTNDPASLELYGSFFNQFELRRGTALPAEDLMRKSAHEFSGNLLYLACNAYPVKKIDSLFTSIENGTTFSFYPTDTATTKNEPLILGLPSSQTVSSSGRLQGKLPGDVIAHYTNLREFNSLLNYFFKRYQEESVANQVKLIHHVDAVAIQQKRDAFKQLPFYVRWIRKALGRGWSISGHTQKI